MGTIKFYLTACIILLLVTTITSYAQSTDAPNILNDTTDNVGSDEDDYSYMMLNFSYTNNNLEYITGVTEKIPSLFSTLSFVNKTGLYAGLSHSSYFNTDKQTYDYEIEAGYQKYFNDIFDIDLYYSWHQFKGDTLLEGLNYDHSVNLSSGLDFDFIYLSADVSYLLGKTNNLFADINLSKFMVINKIFFKDDYLMISPTISAAFGTDYWLYEDMTVLEKSSLANSLKLSGFSSDEFSFEGFNFYIPISYAIRNTALSFSYMYKIPSGKYKELGWENQSAFMISLTWFLNFNTK